MKCHLRHSALGFLGVIGVSLLAGFADAESDQTTKLDATSASGLQLHCNLAATTFTVGQPVNVWCLVTNTTASVKPIVWHPSAGSHYCLVRGETNWMGGVLPLVIPQLREAITIKSASWLPEYLLYVPPHSSVQLLLTYKPDRPETFKGRVVYNPMINGGGFAGDDTLQKTRQGCLFSNLLEYEVTAEDRK